MEFTKQGAEEISDTHTHTHTLHDLPKVPLRLHLHTCPRLLTHTHTHLKACAALYHCTNVCALVYAASKSDKKKII